MTPPLYRLSPLQRWSLAFGLTALTYALAGIAALPLVLPPGYAAPIYPAAGIGLAAVLVYGARMVPAVALGSLCVNLAMNLHGHAFAPRVLPVLGALALGAGLEALVGARLAKRLARGPVMLSAPGEIARFVLAAMFAGCVGPGVAGVALHFSHALSMSQLPFSLATWWIGDVLGMLSVAPVVLTLIGVPRDAWAPRRRNVGLSFALATILVMVGIHRIAAWNADRIRLAFERDAVTVADSIEMRSRLPLEALEAMRSVMVAADHLDRARWHRASAAWLKTGPVEALGWAVWAPRGDLAALEGTARSEGLEAYTVHDWVAAPAAGAIPERRPTTAAEVLAMRYIEPATSSADTLGLNILSMPAARAAVLAARSSGKPAASGLMRLAPQSADAPDRPSIVIYRAIDAADIEPEAPPGEFDGGVVAATVVPSRLLETDEHRRRPYLRLCLVDVSAGAVAARLGGVAGCESLKQELHFQRVMDYAGRQWALTVTAMPGDMPGGRSFDIWLFALVGLLSAGGIGGFLLAITGRTRRIESAVADRTAALRAQVREREVAEAALRESEQRFRNILNTVPIGVIYTDLRGDVKQTNPRFRELTGYSEHEMLQLSLTDYTHPDEIARDIDLMAKLVRGDIPGYRRQTRYLTRRGDTAWVAVTVSLLRDANAKPRSIVGVVEDVTESRKLEDAERAREAAEASNRAKSDFLSRMSHELRTPLNAMLGFAQLLEIDPRHPLSDAQRPRVDQIQQAGWHLLEMINDVLDLSRIESGNVRLQLQTCRLATLLDASVALVEGDAAKRRIVITCDLGPGTKSVIGDPTRVKQILTNLLSNAVKYNADGGRVQVSAHAAADDRVEIVVTDTGLGMTPQQLADLFQPFNRLGRETSEREGTGIGLVISQRLAELMGGALRAQSSAGVGSAFIFTLPRAVDGDTIRGNLDTSSTEAPGYHRRLVHYIEDNETNVQVMRGIMAQRPQVELGVSMLGFEGLAAVRERRPDLILLDMHLPDTSGLDLLRRLKQDASVADIPVVVVSADALGKQIEAAFTAGCAHYLTKPVDVAELLAVVDRLLESAETRFG